MGVKKTCQLIQIILAIVLCLSAAPSIFSQDDYSSPHYESLPIPSEGLGLEAVAQEKLLDALASLARDFDDLSSRKKAKAIAVSRRIDPLHKNTFIADYQLSRGASPEPTGLYEGFAQASAAASESALAMSRSENEEEQWLAFHLLGLLNEIDAGQAKVVAGLNGIRNKAFESKWDEVFSEAKGNAGSGSSLKGAQVREISLLSTGGILRIDVKADSSGGENIQFLQEGDLVTPYFISAFREGVKYLEVTQSGALRGMRVAFETESREEDFFDYQGPAAALPGLVALRSLVDQAELDSSVVLAGDVNADGTIQPLYDILERVESLQEGDPMIIGIPLSDYSSISDTMILDGPRIFVKHQIFSLKTFSDAVALSATQGERAEKLAEAIEKFTVIQDVLSQPGGQRHIKHPSTVEKLREVLTLAPNHLSARMLGLWATNQVPKRLSLAASLDIVIDPVTHVLEGEKRSEETEEKEREAAALKTLNQVQSSIDPRLIKLNNAVIQYSNTGRIGDNRRAEINAAAIRVRDEYEAIAREPAIREELMR